MISISTRELPVATRASMNLLDTLFAHVPHDPLTIRLWDGTIWPDARESPVTLVIHDPGSVRRMFTSLSEVRLGEAFLYGDYDVEGDIEALIEVAARVGERRPDASQWLTMARILRRLPRPPRRDGITRSPARLFGRRHSIERDRQAVQYHYDVSNEFFRLWLDDRMIYSCAYFRDSTDTIHSAQERKLDYICKKLRLLPGERLLDIGCGWGGLIIYAAEHYGVDATGITLSPSQASLAEERIADAGLADHCRVEIRDYREVGEPEAYDKVVSVGMVEHVGLAMLPVYFQHAYRSLRPGGVFLNHGIAESDLGAPRGRNPFVDTYVFPDGELLPINETLRAAEQAGFEVRDVESLREHYLLTLRSWISRLERSHDRALEFVDEPTYRTWRLYMAGSAFGFRSGALNLYQTLLAKPTADGCSHLPLTRDAWYQQA